MAGPPPSKLSLVPKLTSLSNQLYSSDEEEQWNLQDDKMFEMALARFNISEETTADLWKRIASAIPSGKTASQAKRHYDLLAEDVASIEAGYIALPNYIDSDPGCLLQSVEGAVEGKGRSTSLPSKTLCGRSASSEQERRKGTPWTEDEHRLFLMGLSKYGKGDWRSISRNLVVSRTPTQVASHAQKYYIRQGGNKNNRRSSIHDINTLSKGGRLSSLATLPSCNQVVPIAMPLPPPPPPLPSSSSPTSSLSSLPSSSLSSSLSSSSSSSSMSLQQASSNPRQTSSSSSSSSMSLQQTSSNPWQISSSSLSPSSSTSFQQTPSTPWKITSSSLSMTLQQASSTPWQASSSSLSSSSSTSPMSLQQACSTAWKTSSSPSSSSSSLSSSMCLQHASSTPWKTISSPSTSLQKPSSNPCKTLSLSSSMSLQQASSTPWRASSSSMSMHEESLTPWQTLYSRPPFITNTLMPLSNFNTPAMQVPHIDRPILPHSSFHTRVPPPYPMPRTTYAMSSQPPSMHQYYS